MLNSIAILKLLKNSNSKQVRARKRKKANLINSNLDR